MYKDKEDDQTSVFDEWMENFFVDPNTSFLDFQTFRMDVFEYATHYLLEVLFEKKPITQITISTDKNNLTLLAASIRGEPVEPFILERNISFPFSLEGRNISAELSTDTLLVSISKKKIKKEPQVYYSTLRFRIHSFNR